MKVITRSGLAESLEEHCKINGLTEQRARHGWRAAGLEMLGCRGAGHRAIADGPRIAPGVAVPVRMFGRVLTPADVIGVEP